ncbi:MAG: endolytic transglycosylase MltG [Minisyncoccia bacterium]
MKYTKLFQIIIFVAALLFISVFYLIINAPSPLVTSIPFAIAKNETVIDLATDLQNKGLIYSDFLFRFYLKLTNQSKNIKAGYYLLPAKLSLVQLVNVITDVKNINDGIFLIKEGETLKNIETDLRSRGILTEDAHLSDFQVKDFISSFPDLFQGAAANNNLEGFLFPDSYHFPPHSLAKDILNTLLSNFQSKVKPSRLLINNNHSFYENLIMASILEKEVKTEDDKRKVADLLWRRIQNKIPLQVDASICYAQSQSFNDCQLTKEAFNVDSPYNTYKNQGLPLTPISNPGLESIKAALNPLLNDYWYYLTDRKTGQTIFSKTYEEHQQARQKYL